MTHFPWQKMRETHVRALKDLRRAAGAERDTHVARVRHELETLRGRARRTVRKERKRSRAYKAQAIEVHRRSTRARQVLQARVTAMAAATVARRPFAGGREVGNGEGMGRRRLPMDFTSSMFGTVRPPPGMGRGGGSYWSIIGNSALFPLA